MVDTTNMPIIPTRLVLNYLLEEGIFKDKDRINLVCKNIKIIIAGFINTLNDTNRVNICIALYMFKAMLCLLEKFCKESSPSEQRQRRNSI